MKKFFSALALVAVVLFPFMLQAKTLTFTINIPEAAYVMDTKDYIRHQFDGQTSIEVDVPDGTGVQVQPNSGYELVSATFGDVTQTPYYGNIYVDAASLAEGSTVTILAQEKQARIFTFTGNPDHIQQITLNGTIYGKEDNVDGKWTLKDDSDYGSSLEILCADGYIVESFTNNATGAEVVNDNSLYQQRVSTYFQASDFPTGADFTISCTTLASVRTVHVSLEVVDGEDSEVSVRRNGEYSSIPSSEWGDIALNPKSELPLTIAATSYNKSIYKVEVNGENITASGSSFYLNNLNDGDKIKVWPNFPDVDVPVKVSFVNENTEGVISGFYVDGSSVATDVWQAEDYTVKLGSQISINFNTSGYQINSVTANGATASTYSYSGIVNQEEGLNIVIDAEKLADFTVKLYYTPGSILVYNSYGTDSPIELPADADEATISVGRNSYLNIVAAEGYVLSQAINLETEATVYLPAYISSDMEIAVYTEKFDRDNKCVFYLAPNTEAENGEWQYANVALSQSNYSLRKDITPVIGYNFIYYSDLDLPFGFNFYPDIDLYINGEQSENQYGFWTGSDELEPNSVIKAFTKGTEVPTYALTIDNKSDGAIEILADYIKALEGTEATVLGETDIEFVFVATADAEGQNGFTIKVNDQEIVSSDEGKYVAHITADSTISIEADVNVSITEITAGAEAPVYNLQGVRVSNPRNGLFIQNGRKVIR